MSFQNKTFEFSPDVTRKEIAGALKCAEDPDCLAFHFNQTTCILLTQMVEGTTTETAMFLRIKGKMIHLVYPHKTSRLLIRDRGSYTNTTTGEKLSHY